MAALINECVVERGEGEAATVSTVARYYAHVQRCDPSRDMAMVVDPDEGTEEGKLGDEGDVATAERSDRLRAQRRVPTHQAEELGPVAVERADHGAEPTCRIGPIGAA